MSDTHPKSQYELLEHEMRQLHAIDHAIGILHWDDAVMISKKGVSDRAEAMATLESMSHERLNSNKVAELIEGAKQEDLGEWQRANLREIIRMRDLACALPVDLVVAITMVGAQCLDNWRTNRGRNDWESTAPFLKEVVELTRQKANCLGEHFGIEPYDALIGMYEYGLTQEHIDGMFDSLEHELPNLIDDALAQQEESPIFNREFSPDDQMVFSRKLMAALGFDFDRGRIDTSHHPFTMGTLNDSRITTRFKPSNFTESTFATIHETGHALYVQGLPAEWQTQPVGRACGMMVHESQSLFMEMQISRSDAFLEYLRTEALESFAPGSTELCWTAEGFRRAVRRVEKSLIRVDADELTYPLHIILRYNMEKRIISGELSVAEIPSVWAGLMKEYLGIATEGNYQNGCMQDIHWFDGTFGYFPCYSVGAITAAQLFAAYVVEHGSPELWLRRGKVADVVDWLRSKIHSQGRRVNGLDLIENATGYPLCIDSFYQHLKNRYLRE